MSAGALTLDIAGPQGAATSAGLLDGVGYIAGALATWIAGYVSDHFGWLGVFNFLAVSAVVAAGSAFMMSRGFRRAIGHRDSAPSATPA
jgi:sugar phosphate permease